MSDGEGSPPHILRYVVLVLFIIGGVLWWISANQEYTEMEFKVIDKIDMRTYVIQDYEEWRVDRGYDDPYTDIREVVFTSSVDLTLDQRYKIIGQRHLFGRVTVLRWMSRQPN